MRDVSKRLLRQQAFLNLDALPDDAIAELVDTCFTESVISLGAPPPPPPASSAVVPPQWLPDPSGRHELRWWDGGRWTEHVSNGGVSGIEEFNVRLRVRRRAGLVTTEVVFPRTKVPNWRLGLRGVLRWEPRATDVDLESPLAEGAKRYSREGRRLAAGR
jgi:hypothetical protein